MATKTEIQVIAAVPKLDMHMCRAPEPSMKLKKYATWLPRLEEESVRGCHEKKLQEKILVVEQNLRNLQGHEERALAKLIDQVTKKTEKIEEKKLALFQKKEKLIEKAQRLYVEAVRQLELRQKPGFLKLVEKGDWPEHGYDGLAEDDAGLFPYVHKHHQCILAEQGKKYKVYAECSKESYPWPFTSEEGEVELYADNGEHIGYVHATDDIICYFD